MKKNNILWISAIAIIMFVGIAGCSQQPQQPASNEQKSSEAKEPVLTATKDDKDAAIKLKIVAGSIGGTWTAISQGAAEAIRRTYNGAEVTVEPGNDGPNSVLVSNGETQLAFSQSQSAVAAVLGTEPYDKPYDNIRAVATFQLHGGFTFLITEKTGMNSIREIVENKYPLRLSVNNKGSSQEIAMRTALDYYKVSYEDIESWGGKVFFLTFKNSFDLMGDGRLDAVIGNASWPSSNFIEAGKKYKVKLLPIEEDLISYTNEKLGTVRDVMPAGTYEFLKEDLPTFSTGLVLITSTSESEDLIYKVTKSIYDNLEYLKSVHNSLGELEPKIMINIGDKLQLHPGAKKFYKEAGLI